METRYEHLTLAERIELYRLFKQGESVRAMSRALLRSPSTVSRELLRNSRPTKVWSGGYEPARAEDLAQRRRRWDNRFKLARDAALQVHVREHLVQGFSPEQISGRLRVNTVIASSLMNRSIATSIIVQPRRITGTVCYRSVHPGVDAWVDAAAVRLPVSRIGCQLPSAAPRSIRAPILDTGKPISCSLPAMVRQSSSRTSGARACCLRLVSRTRPRSQSPIACCGSFALCRHRFDKP